MEMAMPLWIEMAMPLGIMGLLLATGVVGTIAPAVLWELDTENRNTPPTPADLRGVRITGLVMIVLAAIGFYSFLTSTGQPAEGPLF